MKLLEGHLINLDKTISCGGIFNPNIDVRKIKNVIFNKNIIVTLPSESYSVLIVKPDGNATVYFTQDQDIYEIM